VIKITHEQFKQKVTETVDVVLRGLGGGILFKVIKPIINLAKPELEDTVGKEPEEVYKWLKTAQKHIGEAIELYENEHISQP